MPRAQQLISVSTDFVMTVIYKFVPNIVFYWDLLNCALINIYWKVCNLKSADILVRGCLMKVIIFSLSPSCMLFGFGCFWKADYLFTLCCCFGMGVSLYSRGSP